MPVQRIQARFPPGLGWGRWLASALLLGVLPAASGCGRKPKITPPPPAVVGESQTGLASWYGHPYHGRNTASGETYDMNGLTAAHRTLPFQTWVRVTNLENKLATTVRINDRGPFIEGRIVDLSRGAADRIGMLGTGTALVRLEVVQQPADEPDSNARYAVQVGAFLLEENARRLQARLARRFAQVLIQPYQAPDGLYYRVRVGREPTVARAMVLAQRLRREPDVASALLVRLD